MSNRSNSQGRSFRRRRSKKRVCDEGHHTDQQQKHPIVLPPLFEDDNVSNNREGHLVGNGGNAIASYSILRHNACGTSTRFQTSRFNVGSQGQSTCSKKLNPPNYDSCHTDGGPGTTTAKTNAETSTANSTKHGGNSDVRAKAQQNTFTCGSATKATGGDICNSNGSETKKNKKKSKQHRARGCRGRGSRRNRSMQRAAEREARLAASAAADKQSISSSSHNPTNGDIDEDANISESHMQQSKETFSLPTLKKEEEASTNLSEKKEALNPQKEKTFDLYDKDFKRDDSVSLGHEHNIRAQRMDDVQSFALSLNKERHDFSENVDNNESVLNRGTKDLAKSVRTRAEKDWNRKASSRHATSCTSAHVASTSIVVSSSSSFSDDSYENNTKECLEDKHAAMRLSQSSQANLHLPITTMKATSNEENKSTSSESKEATVVFSMEAKPFIPSNEGVRRPTRDCYHSYHTARMNTSRQNLKKVSNDTQSSPADSNFKQTLFHKERNSLNSCKMPMPSSFYAESDKCQSISSYRVLHQQTAHTSLKSIQCESQHHNMYRRPDPVDHFERSSTTVNTAQPRIFSRSNMGNSNPYKTNEAALALPEIGNSNIFVVSTPNVHVLTQASGDKLVHILPPMPVQTGGVHSFSTMQPKYSRSVSETYFQTQEHQSRCAVSLKSEVSKTQRDTSARSRHQQQEHRRTKSSGTDRVRKNRETPEGSLFQTSPRSFLLGRRKKRRTMEGNEFDEILTLLNQEDKIEPGEFGADISKCHYWF